MVQLLPLNASFVQADVRNLIVSVGQLLLVLRADLSESHDLAMQLLQAFSSEDTRLVEGGDSWPFSLAFYDARVHNLFHHGLFSCITVALANEVRALNLGNWLTALVRATVLSLGTGLIRSALLRDKIGLLEEEAVQKRPSALAAFVHVVACHGLLS